MGVLPNPHNYGVFPSAVHIFYLHVLVQKLHEFILFLFLLVLRVVQVDLLFLLRDTLLGLFVLLINLEFELV